MTGILSFLLDLNLGVYRSTATVSHQKDPKKKVSMEKRQAERWREVWRRTVSFEPLDQTMAKAS